MNNIDAEKLCFTNDGWEENTAWQTVDKRLLKKINQLIADIMRNGNEGMGHPEPLKHELSGYWSRTIDDKNRLIYKILDDGRILIAHCNGHYCDK